MNGNNHHVFNGWSVLRYKSFNWTRKSTYTRCIIDSYEFYKFSLNSVNTFNTFHHTTVFHWRSHFLYDTFERNSMFFSTYKIRLLIYYIEHSMKLTSFTYLQFCIQQSVENKKKWKESVQICMEFFISIDHCDTISGTCIDLLESTRKSLWWYNEFFVCLFVRLMKRIETFYTNT